MPFSGKSTIGKLTAKDLGWEFLDLDELIKKEQGIFHSDFLEKFGDEALLDLEEKLTLKQELTNKIFSPGGSIIFKEKAMGKIKLETIVVYLKVSLEDLKRRAVNLNSRGIVGLKKFGFDKIFELRTPIYEKFADIIITNKGKTDLQIVHKILSEYKLIKS